MNEPRHTFSLQNLMASVACFAIACGLLMYLLEFRESDGSFYFAPFILITPLISTAVGVGLGILLQKVWASILIGFSFGPMIYLYPLSPYLSFAPLMGAAIVGGIGLPFRQFRQGFVVGFAFGMIPLLIVSLVALFFILYEMAGP